MLGDHNILNTHTQYHFPQAKVTKSVHKFQGSFVQTSTYWYVPVMYMYILTQITLTHYFQSGTIALVTITSLLPTLV